MLKDAENGQEFIKKDSADAVKFLDSLAENNYYFTDILSVEKKNQRTEILFRKGKNYNRANVKIPDSTAKILRIKPEFFTNNLDSLKRSINKKFIEDGYSFSRIKTKYLGMGGGVPLVELSVIKHTPRSITGFTVKGYEKIPKRFVKNLEKEFRGEKYNEKHLLAIQQQLKNHPFFILEQPPQTLFTKDSTTIFLFLQKKKASTFDGVLGFGNDRSEKFSFNGSLNVSFKNIFNGFESIDIFWQRNPDKGQTFDLSADIPYMLGSNLGASLRTNIYRQNSAFATVRLLPSVYYHFNNHQKIGLRGNFETSSVNDVALAGKNYSKKGGGIWYEFSRPSENPLLQVTTKIRLEADLLRADYEAESRTSSQAHYFINAEHNHHLNSNHWINLRAESALLKSGESISTNELLRFGGWNSLRGFNENSLLADFYWFSNVEYRYLVGEQAFFDVFGQYGSLQNKSLNASPKFYSLGLGFHFLLPVGLMSLQVSNGTETANAMRFKDTKIHWGIITRF